MLQRRACAGLNHILNQTNQSFIGKVLEIYIREDRGGWSIGKILPARWNNMTLQSLSMAFFDSFTHLLDQRIRSSVAAHTRILSPWVSSRKTFMLRLFYMIQRIAMMTVDLGLLRMSWPHRCERFTGGYVIRQFRSSQRGLMLEQRNSLWLVVSDNGQKGQRSSVAIPVSKRSVRRSFLAIQVNNLHLLGCSSSRLP